MRILHIVPAVIAAAVLTLVGTTSVVGGAGAPDLVAVARADAERGDSVPAARVPPPPARATDDAAVAVVERTNAVRAQYGLAPLAIQPQLVEAAQAHSNDQAARQRMSHVGADGSSVADRLDATGYSWSRVAENVAAGQPTATRVTDAWLGSPGHRANMLDGALVHIGVAVAYSSSGTPYWTMVLSAPR